MKEARIICPMADNNGASAHETLARVRYDLARRFGGFTETPGRGGWISPNRVMYEEPVTVFDVACDGTDKAMTDLRQVAAMIGRNLRQEAVYLRAPDGEVHFIATGVEQVAA